MSLGHEVSFVIAACCPNATAKRNLSVLHSFLLDRGSDCRNIGLDLIRSFEGRGLSSCMRGGVRMSMRDQYRTKAAEFEARALCESNQMARYHFETMAQDYVQLADLAAQIDSLEKLPESGNSD